MIKRVLLSAAVLSAALAGSASAQGAPAKRLSIEPYVAYGFFGDLPETASSLEAGIGYGGRVAYQLSPQWAVFGNYQRSSVELQARDVRGGDDVRVGDVDVDHWAGGIEFSYVPRGGAEGMLPIILEAGLGQARYSGFTTGDESDLAVKLGLSSALQLTPNIGLRYGVDDYISNFRDAGITNQVFARAGVELSF